LLIHYSICKTLAFELLDLTESSKRDDRQSQVLILLYFR